MFPKFLIITLISLLGLVSTNDFTDNRIVGGEWQNIEDRRFQVAVRPTGFICGGSLIKWDLVLTAAHCTVNEDPLNYKVRAGSNYFNKDGIEVGVKNVINHPYFNIKTMTHDLSLLKLNESFSESLTINTIEIAPSLPRPGENVIVSGFGTTSSGGDLSAYLRSVTLQYIDFGRCNANYNYDLTSTMICAGVNGGGKDSCQGDSGSPLTYEGKLIGVVSFGTGCALEDYPGVYTNVLMLKPWIDFIINYNQTNIA